jgi:DNA-3-methyladenine glycosylase II
MIAQLISTPAARSINARLEAALGGKVTPSRLLALTDDELKACGVSGNKAKAIRGLAEHFRANRGFARAVARADDLTVRERLLPLRGVGPWTVDMVLMFAFSRLDVLPVGDLGLRAGVRDLYGLRELPTSSELTEIAEPWRPYRSVGTWYLWRYRGWTGRFS